MANVTEEIQLDGLGQDGRRFHVPVNTGANIYYGTKVAQLANGLLVAATVAGAGPAIGKAVQTIVGAAAGQRCVVETDRIFALTNGTAGDAFTEAHPIGAPAYSIDDHTAANNSSGGTRQPCGTFQGLEASGKVRILMSTDAAGGGALPIQAGRGTLVAGVLVVNAGVRVTATSRVFASRVTEAGTDGDELRCPDADRVVGGPGTGAITIRSFLSGTAATSDTSTVDWLIVG